MKAVIKIASVKKLSPDQLAIIKRVMLVLQQHDLSVGFETKKKITYNTKLKIVG